MEVQPLADRTNALEIIWHAALKRLLRTPVSDLRALVMKIELVLDHKVAQLDGEMVSPLNSCTVTCNSMAVLKAEALKLARALAN